MTADKTYDVVVVGSGVVGATFAKVVAEQANRDGKAVSILILEAGRRGGLAGQSYQAYVDRYHSALAKVPDAPYPNVPNAPAPAILDFLKPVSDRYYRQTGKLPFGSNNTRALGGSTLHWLGVSLRMMRRDFRMAEDYGVGVNWPIGYDDLKAYYEMAEWELGVAANAADQLQISGVQAGDFGEYEYPMQRIPQSYGDALLSRALGQDFTFSLWSAPRYPVRLVPIPQARNSTPTAGAQDPRRYLAASRSAETYRPYGAADDPVTGIGQRCEGNSSCIPICPSRAKYTALKTISQLQDLSKKRGISVDIVTKAVASTIHIGVASGRVTHITYKRYENGDLPYAVEHEARAKRFVLAASAIENAKLLLASRTVEIPGGVANESGQVGKNLMDHPFMLTWALMPEGTEVGPFRGPGATSDIPIRDGTFRKKHAAFRTDVANWGWNLPEGAPYTDLERLIDPGAFEATYAGKGPHRQLLPSKPLFGEALRKQLRGTVQRQIRLGFLLEQLPSERNQITIDDDWRDQLGIHRPVLNYDIDEYTRRGMEQARRLSRNIFRQVDAVDYTDYSLSIGHRIKTPTGCEFKYIGAGHIMGTHRMGRDRNDSVVDESQRSWDHDNLYIMGCGSMPTTGTSNPTLTAVALAIKSARELYCDLELVCR